MQRVENPKKMVDMGCGKTVWEFEGEGTPLRVDIREDVNPDFRCDIADTPFEDGQFEIVFSSHTLEHNSRSKVPKVLKEWIRILAEGGELRIVVPNLEWAAKNILDGILDNNTMNVLYGQQEYKENFHQTGFTPKSLRTLLESFGLEVVEENLDGFHLLMRAVKPEKLKESTEEESTEIEEAQETSGASGDAETKLEDATDAPLLTEQPQNLGSGGGSMTKSLKGKEI
jgi:predicted SAM-dependent methyltransferase